jgi:hypothetical protein
VRPQLDRLVRQRRQRDLRLGGERVGLGHGGHERLVPDAVLVDSGPGADVGGQGHVDASLAEHPLDVLGEDLTRPHPEPGVLRCERIDQRR